MATKRDGLKENRESFVDAKRKAAFEKEVDQNELRVEEKKLEKEIKKLGREHK